MSARFLRHKPNLQHHEGLRPKQEQSENCVTQPELAPPTHDKYNRAAYNWVLTISSNLKVLRRILYYHADELTLLKNSVIVHGITDNTFKNISSIEKLLAQRLPKGRES
ncbi:hypothetical protein N7449_001978 [Penicillium cf. viridicatum]|uniref:Uncharacterized protein n=1 Tax=Penicillium cf. viridicatum TaxID=2972119 RepID=A0A9W9MU40_9EURO|nr:hypothetical protein N7449_001978 [Penicillium cf. viridicatum]